MCYDNAHHSGGAAMENTNSKKLITEVNDNCGGDGSSVKSIRENVFPPMDAEIAPCSKFPCKDSKDADKDNNR
jgi:hypothetical protein